MKLVLQEDRFGLQEDRASWPPGWWTHVPRYYWTVLVTAGGPRNLLCARREPRLHGIVAQPAHRRGFHALTQSMTGGANGGEGGERGGGDSHGGLIKICN